MTLSDVPVEFILFGLTLASVALFHRHTLRVAVIGLVAITLYLRHPEWLTRAPVIAIAAWIAIVLTGAACSCSRWCRVRR